MSNIRLKVRELCLHALEGKLSRKDLPAQWPPNANESPLLRQVYADLIDGIRHYPRYWFKKGVDMEKWRDQLEYNPILLDSTLLLIDKTEDLLLKSRAEIFNEEYLEAKLEKLKKRRLAFKRRLAPSLTIGLCLILAFCYWYHRWWDNDIAQSAAKINVMMCLPFDRFYEKYSRRPKDMNEIRKFIRENRYKIPLNFSEYTYQSFEETPKKSLKVKLVYFDFRSHPNWQQSAETELSLPAKNK